METSEIPYIVGDIINFWVKGANCIGEIVKVLDSCYIPTTEYNVKLLTTAKLRTYGDEPPFKLRPSGSIYVDEEVDCNPSQGVKWYTRLEKNNEGLHRPLDEREWIYDLHYVRTPIKRINFSIKRTDIERYKSASTDGERFKILLRGRWKDLVMRKVKMVKVPEKVLGVSKYVMDERGNVDTCRGWDTWGSVPDKIEPDTFYDNYYSNYFGFARKFGEDAKDIHFSRDSKSCKYVGLDFNVNHTCWFSGWANHMGGYHPPLVNQFICGIVEQGEKGPYFSKWFICSDQFFHFYKFIMSESEYTKRKTDELLKLVDTDVYPDGIKRRSNGELSEEQRKSKMGYVHKNLRCWDYSDHGCYKVWVEYILGRYPVDDIPGIMADFYHILGQ